MREKSRFSDFYFNGERVFKDALKDPYYLDRDPAGYIVCYEFDEDDVIHIAKL